jgi:hypothetical protein
MGSTFSFRSGTENVTTSKGARKLIAIALASGMKRSAVKNRNVAPIIRTVRRP